MYVRWKSKGITFIEILMNKNFKQEEHKYVGKQCRRNASFLSAFHTQELLLAVERRLKNDVFDKAVR